jgi:hypothetical protein
VFGVLATPQHHVRPRPHASCVSSAGGSLLTDTRAVCVCAAPPHSMNSMMGGGRRSEVPHLEQQLSEHARVDPLGVKLVQPQQAQVGVQVVYFRQHLKRTRCASANQSPHGEAAAAG